VTRQRIAAAGGFDQNIRPDDAGLDVDGRHLGDADADFVAAEPRPFASDDRLVRHLDDGGKQEIPMCPTACLKSFRSHDRIIGRTAWQGNAILKSSGSGGRQRTTCSATFFLRHQRVGFNLVHQTIGLMLWFKRHLRRKFWPDQGGGSTSQVLDLLGSPTEVEDSEVPRGSDWGNQPGMTFEMRPVPVKQWMFENDGEFITLVCQSGRSR